MQRALIAGVVVLALLILGLMRWAALTEITGAVIAEGTVVVESSLKKIQHPSGGTVKEVRVRNGDRIAGRVLIRLDGGEIKTGSSCSSASFWRSVFASPPSHRRAGQSGLDRASRARQSQPRAMPRSAI